jgi:phosphonoacetate hydrolase
LGGSKHGARSSRGRLASARAADHDLSGLAGHRLRTHGGVFERKAPIMVSAPLNVPYRLKAATATSKRWQLFDNARNGTRAAT